MSAHHKTPGGFVSLNALKGRAPVSTDAALSEIRRIYFTTTRQTIQHDLAHAIELLKSLPDEETRDRAAVYMDGLNQMRSEWTKGQKAKAKGQKGKK